MSTTENCCEEVDLTKYDPRIKASVQREVKFSHPENPIPAQIEDRNQLRDFFERYRNVFVPYSGNDQTTSHTLLYFLYNLPDLSPTLGAVIERIKSYSFGGKVDIIRREDPVFNIENPGEVSPSEKLGFYQFIKDNITFHGVDGQVMNVRDFGQQIWLERKKTGNAYVEMVFTETLGEKAVSLHLHKATHCLYLLTEKGEQKYVGISPVWDTSYVRKYPPDLVPIYPGTVEEDGARRTLFHLKNGNYVWYGRNDWMNCVQSAYNEFQALDYRIKQTKAGFIGAGIIEYEEENPETVMRGDTEDGNISNDIDNNFTTRADDPQTFVMMTRPYGARPLTFERVEPNTDSQWVETTGKENRMDIIVANQWSERMLGNSTPNGFSSDVFFSEFETIIAPVIRSNQEVISDFLNTVVMQATKHLETSEFDGLSLALTSPFREQIENRNAANADNSMGGGEVQPGE